MLWLMLIRPTLVIILRQFDDVETIETRHGGFYVNMGHVDGDDDLSDDEPLVAGLGRKSPGYVSSSTCLHMCVYMWFVDLVY